MALVEVRPIDGRKWHNKKGKESFAMPKVIEALYDGETGAYATGLTDEEANLYGKLLSVDLSNRFVIDTPHPFWSSKAGQLKLENATMFFNTDKTMDFVKVKLMKASKLVANSMKEYNENKWPEATHVIFDEEEEVDIKASKVAAKQQCALILDKMNADDKANMILILGKRFVKGRSDNFLNVEIDALIELDPIEFLKYAKAGKDKIYNMGIVLEALHKNVLTKNAGKITYMGETIGLDVEDAIKWLNDPENQRIKIAVLNKLTNNKQLVS